MSRSSYSISMWRRRPINYRANSEPPHGRALHILREVQNKLGRKNAKSCSRACMMCAKLVIPLSRREPYDLPEEFKPFSLAGPWSTGWKTITRRKKETADALVVRCETAIRDEQACCPLALRDPPPFSFPHARECTACTGTAA